MEPGLAVVCRVDNVSIPVCAPIERNIAAASSRGGQGGIGVEPNVGKTQGEQIVTVLVRIAHRRRESSREQLSQSNAPLCGARELELVIDQPEFGLSIRAGEGVQSRLVRGAVGIVSGELADGRASPLGAA